MPAVSEPDFELIFNALPGLYLILDADLCIVAVSNAYLAATMTVRDQILSRNIFDVFPDDPSSEATGVHNLRTSLECVLTNKVADTMAVQRYPIRTQLGDQETFELRYWSPTNSPVLSEADGELKYIIHRVEDVTEYILSVQKSAEAAQSEMTLHDKTVRMEAEIFARAQEIQEANRKLQIAHAESNRLNQLLELRSAEREEALKSSDERFRLLVDGVSEYAIFMLDPAGRIVSWNQGAQRIYGYAEESVLGESLAIFFSPEDQLAQQPDAELAAARQHGSAESQGWRVRRDGSKFWSSGVITSLYNDMGEVRGFAKIMRDMTKSRQAETLLRSIVDTAIDGIITIDSSGIIRTSNRAAQEMFGYAADEMVGHNVKMLMPEPDQTQHDQYIQNYLQTGQAKIIGIGREVEGLRKNGKRFPIELSISHFEHDGQRGFTGLLRDITERKELQRQYHHSQKMQAVGTLAGGIAHDFNNLLTVIIGYCELLTNYMSPGCEESQLVSEIHHAGTRAALLTRQLLTFSRQQTSRPVIVDLNNVVHDCSRMLTRLIREDIQVATDLLPQPCFIRADPSQMEQVLLNLAINARDAMPGGGKLAIVTRIVPAASVPCLVNLNTITSRDQEFVLLQVIDDGDGMDLNIQSRIFEPFFTTKGVGKGTGLGLSVVDGIVRQVDGCIQLQSEPGQGTTFNIFLPLASSSDLPEDQRGVDRVLHGTEAILLVEDDSAVREYTARALESCGYQVIKAKDISDALELITRTDSKIDLLLTDVVMPEISGFQLIDMVKSLRPQTRYLLVSGYPGEEIARKQLDDSQHPLLQKPFTMEALCSTVRRVLDAVE